MSEGNTQKASQLKHNYYLRRLVLPEGGHGRKVYKLFLYSPVDNGTMQIIKLESNFNEVTSKLTFMHFQEAKFNTQEVNSQRG